MPPHPARNEIVSVALVGNRSQNMTGLRSQHVTSNIVFPVDSFSAIRSKSQIVTLNANETTPQLPRSSRSFTHSGIYRNLCKFCTSSTWKFRFGKEECCHCDSVASCQFQFPIGADLKATNIGIGNIGIGNTSTLATFAKCCQCDNVASCQFQFPMKEAC